VDADVSKDLKTNWLDFLGPVVDQGTCSNCWAESLVQVFDGIVNYYLEPDAKIALGLEGIIQLSSQ
jgi:hypothetical protein